MNAGARAMPLDSTNLARMREMLHILRRDAPDASTDFYQALFERAPELRTLFRDSDLAGQGRKFMAMLGLLVDACEDYGRLGNEIRELGRGHVAYGVEARFFPPMEEALIDTMRSNLGERFTPELEADWRKLYAIVANEMMSPDS